MAVVLWLTGCEPTAATPPPPTRAEAAPLRIDVVGDSLVNQSARKISAVLSEDGLEATVASMPSQPLNSPFIQQALSTVAAQPGDIVVVATASNDALAQATVATTMGQDQARATYRDLLGGIAERFKDRCVVVVNARDVSPLYNPFQAAVVNSDIAVERQQRKNMVVVDWASISRGHGSDWFVADLEHFGPDVHSTENLKDGAQAYADAIRDGVDRCADLLRSPV